MRIERSAGVIVFLQPKTRTPAASFPDDPKRRYLLLDYGRYWDYPKGHVEAGEDDLTAALRELKEEAGIADVDPIDGFREEMTYFFRDKKKGLIKKTVVFFLAAAQSDEITVSHEHEAGEFVPYDDALERLTYPYAKKLLKAAQEFLTNRR